MRKKRLSFRERMEEESNRRNGLYNLDQTLQDKIKLYEQATAGEKVCKYFSWKDFCVIFATTTYLWLFNYDDSEFGIFNECGMSYFYTEGDEKRQYFCLKCSQPEDLLKNASIDGKYLSELWEEMYI